jgi:F-type H+-transporting ATPase subunit alpha
MNTYQTFLDEIGEYGVTEEIKHPIVTLSGLPNAHPNEVLLFETGEVGEIFTIERDFVKAFVFAKEPVKVGTKVVRANMNMAVPVGEELLGQVINPLGNPIFENNTYKKPKTMREIDQPVKSIDERARITKFLATGTSIVDLLVPLGQGQRELVIGDRKTGKTAFLNTVIRQQVAEGNIVVYAAIGKKRGEIKKMVEYFEEHKMLQKMVVVVTDSQDPSSLIFLTPLTAMCIAEFFRDNKQNVVLLLDDLTTHAKFYREVSLLSDRFPGRDSYPGDIFYTHAKLLERAGNIRYGEKEAYSITCLPIVETVEGDLTGYIQTNLMGITDGHIFFDSNAYYNGRRPAINVGYSVTRVGKQTQTKLKKDVTRELGAFLASYEKMQNFSHFGAELSPQVVQALKRGEKLYELFDQHYNMAIPVNIQLVLVGMVWSGYFNELPKTEMEQMKKALSTLYAKEEVRTVIDELVAVDTLEELSKKVASSAEAIAKLCKTNVA